MTLNIKLGKYTLIEELGSGGFGTVYKAKDAMKRNVAIKMLKPGWSGNSDAVERFRREAKATGDLFHQNIATTISVGQAKGRIFLVMRYVDGISLEKLITERGRLEWDEALNILKDVAEALDYAHKHGFIHRDVKPANILISKNEGAILTDFGLVKAAKASKMTTGVTLGTINYIAPEIWDGHTPSSATDVYSLACVFFEMITGEKLFGGDSAPHIMKQHLEEGPLLHNKLPNHAPSDLQNVLEKALAKAPEDRFAEVSDFRTAIENVQDYEDGHSKRRFAFPFWAWIVVAVVLIASIVGLIMLRGNEPAPEITSTLEKMAVQSVTPLRSSTPRPSSTPIPSATAAPTDAPTDTEIPSPQLFAGATQISPKVGKVMLYIPAGEFEMGSKDGEVDEKPVHTVNLNAFWIDKTEVTNAMFAVFLNEMGNQSESRSTWLVPSSKNPLDEDADGKWNPKSGYEQHPVVEVSWYGAQAFCEWAGGRLPTEAEWEKAARGTDGRTYPWGEVLDCDKAHYSSCWGEIIPVGSLADGDSPYGAADMAGNVWEWVADWYVYDYYSTLSLDNPLGPSSGLLRVRRGGSRFNKSWNIRAANRDGYDPSKVDVYLGFRCAMDAEQP